uniref:Uncharacterized protein n=1 Tax=Anopheles maculatus TaxID=74869 RepID=A0A182S8H2_9DIPT
MNENYSHQRNEIRMCRMPDANIITFRIGRELYSSSDVGSLPERFLLVGPGLNVRCCRTVAATILLAGVEDDPLVGVLFVATIEAIACCFSMIANASSTIDWSRRINRASRKKRTSIM